MRFWLILSAALALSSCGPSGDEGPIRIAMIASPESLFEPGVRLSPAAQHLRAATAEGMVTLDEAGQIVPALAERWIVTDDGMSYIFRLREGSWPDGKEITAADVRRRLREAQSRLQGTSLGLDLARITDIRAMTGRVIELRLSAPMPDFLRVLAQPELGLGRGGAGTGPMVMTRKDKPAEALLTALPPEERGLPAREDWQDTARPLSLEPMSARGAVAAFSRGDVDLVLGGSIADFPLAEAGPLSRGTIQVDPARGLLGLAFRHENGFLADPARREALSMAIDRAALIQPFGLGGWQSATWIVPPQAFDAPPYPENRWGDAPVEALRRVAAARVRGWTAAGREARLRIALPPGPGSDLLFAQVAAAWAPIGVTAVRVRPGDPADLELRDTIARYGSPRWYLNQFNCRLRAGLCSLEADVLAAQSLATRDPAASARLLAEASAALAAREVYIPLGAPVRWSLVRGSIRNYVANQWGVHPLFPLSQPTI